MYMFIHVHIISHGFSLLRFRRHALHTRAAPLKLPQLDHSALTNLSLVQTHQDKRARGHQEEIYWLRPTQPSRSPAPGKSMSPRAKVTFDEAGIMTSPR